jgi:adenylate cyclase
MHDQAARLAVILHADVVGSTALVQRDESLAHNRMQDAFRRFADTITSHEGEVRELRGDALLAEFKRASDAAAAALSFQQQNQALCDAIKDPVVPRIRVGIAMGVRYLLMGSVRKSVNKVRINARLIDSANGQPVWTHRYDRKLTDIFEIQDEVTKHIVNELSVRLTKKEERRLNEATTRNIDAYDVFLQGQERVSRFNPIDNAVGREFFEKAKRLDPGYARAHAGIALTHFYDQIFGWSADKAASIAASLEAAELALALDSELPHVYVAVGSAKMGSRQFDEAVDYLRRSIEIAPNYADGHAQYAAVLASAGKNEEALKHIDIAMQLNPHYSYIYLYIKSLALFYLRQLEDTLPLIEDTVLRNPEFDRPQLLYASTLGHLGQIDEAEWALMEALTLSPDLTLADELANHPYKRQEDKAFYIEGLRKAGLQ